MFKVDKIMFTCVVNIMGGRLWLYYAEYDKHVDIELHAQVLTLIQYMVVKRGHYDRLLTRKIFHLGFINNMH